MKKDMVGSVPGNVLGMLADLAHKLQHGVIASEELGLFLQRKNPFGVVKAAFAAWKDFYQKFFGLTLDVSGIQIPEHRDGFDRLIVVAQGLTPNQVYDVCAKQFPCWSYTKDLDEATRGRNDRESDQTYAVWVRDRQEADEENKNTSAAQLKERRVPGITLLERMIYELKYWSETNEHLDQQCWTLCSGSRCAGGFVPYAFWYDVRFKVSWYYPDRSFDYLRARSVVSLPA